jgi:hypothetical protein
VPETPETAMRPKDVPEELIDLAMTGAKPGCRSDAAFYLANTLPAHEAMVRRHFADVIETRFGPVDPETGQVYDKTALEVVRWLRGEQP